VIDRRGWTVVGLGGNVGGPAAVAARFAAARAAIEAIAGVGAAMSRGYGTAPQGPVADQPAFLNAALGLPWRPDDPAGFLAALKAIEVAHGRVGGVAQGPRPLDLDVLRIGDARIAAGALEVPHPRMLARRFVLAPLADVLGGDFVLDGATIAARLARPEIAAQPVEVWSGA
jgi:2-amino-4-hydroxy-6-hydroxymethyldihydropteridine diphosphokinase